MNRAILSTSIMLSLLCSTIGITLMAAPIPDTVRDKREWESNPVDGDVEYVRYLIYTAEKRTPGNYMLPVNYLFNMAFDSAQVPIAFKQSGYFRKYETVWNRIKDPVKSINRDGGFKKFFLDEWTSSRAAPNYMLHVIGGGYDFRMLAEWYTYNGVPGAYFFSFLTAYLAHFSNEALETSNRYLTSHDHIADLFFFDAVGKLLFLSSDVVRFFHNFLQMRNWMGQPMFDVRKGRIHNAACNYVMRPYIYKKMVRFIFMMGYQHMGGFGFRISDTDWITIAAGVAVTKGFNPDRQKKAKDGLKNFRTCGGIFYDRDGNLMASLILNGTENYKLRLNVYPDLLNIDRVNFGVFLGIDDYNRVP
ncbi:MAG: hypothetical protein E4G96_02675 [Chrysiogenales bacterium]|nr:MAG: hypothetical protein E4G96_02675 [Chrysiogenales bacterium]